jgi:hypothetical protein
MWKSLSHIDQRLEPSLRTKVGKVGSPFARCKVVHQQGRLFGDCGRSGSPALMLIVPRIRILYLLQDYLTRLALSSTTRPASEFELVIPIEDEAELIAARDGQNRSLARLILIRSQ